MSIPAYIRGYKEELISCIRCIDPEAMSSALQLLQATRVRNGMAYVCGNGGSAANASHMALHLSQAGLKTICLTDNVPMLTAHANDLGYDQVFSAFTLKYCEPGDLLILISGSGNSWNILQSLETKMADTIALLGMDGGELGKQMENYGVKIIVPSRRYGPIEDSHSAIIHMLADMLKSER